MSGANVGLAAGAAQAATEPRIECLIGGAWVPGAGASPGVAQATAEKASNRGSAKRRNRDLGFMPPAPSAA